MQFIMKTIPACKPNWNHQHSEFGCSAPNKIALSMCLLSSAFHFYPFFSVFNIFPGCQHYHSCSLNICIPSTSYNLTCSSLSFLLLLCGCMCLAPIFGFLCKDYPYNATHYTRYLFWIWHFWCSFPFQWNSPSKRMAWRSVGDEGDEGKRMKSVYCFDKNNLRFSLYLPSVHHHITIESFLCHLLGALYLLTFFFSLLFKLRSGFGSALVSFLYFANDKNMWKTRYDEWSKTESKASERMKEWKKKSIFVSCSSSPSCS